jgi:predicted RNA-binding protein with PUA-like domain
MRYWLMKSEPDEVSFADVIKAPRKTVAWFGVRNYQAKYMCPCKNGQSATSV